MNVIGDVNGRTCILQDDIIDTAGTIQKAADALKKAGRSASWPARCTACFPGRQSSASKGRPSIS